ncbi:hypothetical protein [Actinoplanes sp. NPDC048796]|uniref:hypothetical protein n=1 Tax=Actinoplanes sp. NPDC048796 TaxID=3155640 RepID=UPI0033F59A48
MTEKEAVAEITRFLQDHYIHEAWADAYGVDVGPDPDSIHVRRPGDLLALARPGEKVATMCQGYSEMLALRLRERGIPAQARCGYATYFQKGWYESHWVVEYGDGRWADAQIDDLQRGALGIDFDTLDLPPGAFLTAPEAWQLVRRGDADPDTFGHDAEWKGDWFIAGDVPKDLVTRQGVATLPWDEWDPMPGRDEEIDVALFDALAAGTRVAAVPTKVFNQRRGRFEDL